MKTIRNVAVLLGLALVLSPLALSAKTMEQTYVESYQGHSASTPAPVAVVAPSVADEGLVELTFVVDASGKPTGIAVKSASDTELIGPVVKAIAQWKFEPAHVNGEAVAKKVELPVHIVMAE